MIKFKQEHKNAVDVEVIGNIYENPEKQKMTNKYKMGGKNDRRI